MFYKPSGSYVKEFVTSTPDGAAANADALPVATANKNGTDDGTFVLTVANVDTGRYKITGTVPSGYVAGDVVNISVAATIGGVAAKGVVDTFSVVSAIPGDLATIKGQAVTCSAGVTIYPAVGLNSTAQAALEDQFDGTGLTGGTYPATQATATSIQSKTDLLPASPAAVGSQMNLAANAVTSASIATGAFTAAKFAADFFTGVWNTILTGSWSSNSAARILRFLRDAGSYGGKIWIDTVGGTAGATPYENGTDSLPVSNIADAYTLLNALNFHQFSLANGSSIALPASAANLTFEGRGATVALNGQVISGARFKDLTVSGVAAPSTGDIHFSHCTMQSCTLPASFVHAESRISGTLSVLDGDHDWSNCFAEPAAKVDFGSATAARVYVSPLFGYLEVLNLGAADFISVDGQGHLTLNASCTGGSIHLHGSIDFVDNSGGAVTVYDYRDASGASVSALATAVSLKATQTSVDAIPTAPLLAVNYVAPDNAGISAIKAKTDNLPAAPAATGDIPSAAANASAVRAELTTELAAVVKLLKMTENKREVKKSGAVWNLLIYDNDGVTVILSKELRDVSGNAVTDLEVGILAQELANAV